MAIPEEMKDSAPLNTQDFTKGIREWKESTSTSLSGRHLGQYYKLLGSTGHGTLLGYLKQNDKFASLIWVFSKYMVKCNVSNVGKRQRRPKDTPPQDYPLV